MLTRAQPPAAHRHRHSRPHHHIRGEDIPTARQPHSNGRSPVSSPCFLFMLGIHRRHSPSRSARSHRQADHSHHLCIHRRSRNPRSGRSHHQPDHRSCCGVCVCDLSAFEHPFLHISLYTILQFPILYGMYCNEGWSGENTVVCNSVGDEG